MPDDQYFRRVAFEAESKELALTAFGIYAGIRMERSDVSMPSRTIPLTTLKWWRELVDLNPSDLVPRLDAVILAEQPAPPLHDDAARMTWLQEQIVDTIYLDDGRFIDVRGNDLRKAIDKARALIAEQREVKS